MEQPPPLQILQLFEQAELTTEPLVLQGRKVNTTKLKRRKSLDSNVGTHRGGGAVGGWVWKHERLHTSAVSLRESNNTCQGPEANTQWVAKVPGALLEQLGEVERTRQETINELISTELAYYRDLIVLIEVSAL